MTPASRWLERALVAGLGVLGLWLAFYPMLRSGFAQMQQDPHDSRLINFVLENGYLWVTGRAQLFSPELFWPVKGAATYTESLVGVMPFYLPFRLAGFEPDTSLQLWMLSMGALNYLAALLLLRRGFGFGWVATALGAFLIAFGSPRLAQLGHQHLLPHFYSLLAVYALARLFSGAPRPRLQLALFFAAVVAQLYAGVYLGWFLCFLLGVAFVFSLALPGPRPAVLALLRAHRWALLASAAGSALALAPLAVAYLGAAHQVGYRTFADAATMLPRVQSWFFLGDRSLLYGRLAYTALYGKLPMWWEHAIGIGLVTLPVAVYALVKERARPAFQVLGATVLAAVVLTLWFRGQWSPWWLVYKLVPGGAALRSVSRIGVVLLIPWGIALSAFFDRPRATLLGKLLAGALALIAVAEQPQLQPAYDKAELRAEVDALAAKIPPGCAVFFYSPHGVRVSRGPMAYERVHLDAMWAALLTHKHTVNGYSGNVPPGYELREAVWETEAQRAVLSAGLQQWESANHLAPGSTCVVP